MDRPGTLGEEDRLLPEDDAEEDNGDEATSGSAVWPGGRNVSDLGGV
jgi:hypothetical protein